MNNLVFPFSALVGQELMKKGLLLNAIDPRIGGVLIRGEKGTAKSTAVRAFARLLPEIAVATDCPYACDPEGTIKCGDCAARWAAGEPLSVSRRPVRVVELPLGATEDRIVGALNLEQAIKEGARVFEPGLLAAANRGILYVDEVNLLNDHLVDVILDAAAMGRNYVEREGISVSHPAQFILVGTMNPEEGDLRPQLLDRFALMAEVRGLRDPALRAAVVRRRIAFEADPGGFIQQWQTEEERERRRIALAQKLLPQVRCSDDLLDLITRICAAYEIDGLRGDIVMYKTALALAAYNGRREVSVQDIEEAAELALPHRRRRQPFDSPDDRREQLEEMVRQHRESTQRTEEGGPDESSKDPDGTDQGPAPPGSEQIFEPGPMSPVRPLASRPEHASQMQRSDLQAGRRRGVSGKAQTGHYIGARPPAGDWREMGNLALDATLRAAAPFQHLRRRPTDGPRLVVLPGDLREKVYERKAGHLILFLVDASGSMAARQRMVAVKGAVLSLLLDAYQKRDRVGLMAFRGDSATMLLLPTNSVDLAERRLRSLPTGGRTPLARALQLGDETIERYRTAAKGWVPWLVLVSDGRPNVPLNGGDPLEDAYRMAERIRARHLRALVIDTETGPLRLGLNRRLAYALGGEYIRLDDLSAGPIETAVRRTLRL